MGHSRLNFFVNQNRKKIKISQHHLNKIEEPTLCGGYENFLINNFFIKFNYYNYKIHIKFNKTGSNCLKKKFVCTKLIGNFSERTHLRRF